MMGRKSTLISLKSAEKSSEIEDHHEKQLRAREKDRVNLAPDSGDGIAIYLNCFIKMQSAANFPQPRHVPDYTFN